MFEKERLRLRGDVEESVKGLTQVRQELLLLEQQNQRVRDALSQQDKIERFIGGLEQALTTIDRKDEDSPFGKEVKRLEEEIRKQRGIYSHSLVERKTENALDILKSIIATIVPELDSEWKTAPVNLIIQDLTIKITQLDRSDYLWEIGSGANWLAYHIAVTLALHRYFDERSRPVPAFLVYDQPSQVYFPRGTDAGATTTLSGRTRDEDIAAVRAVFSVIGQEIVRSKGQLQAIILDHAGKEVWGDIEGVILIEEWRDDAKLVPTDWIVGDDS